MVDISHSSMYIGLDVGGTFVKGARIDGEGRVAARLHEPVAKDSAEEMFRQIEAVVATLDNGGAVRAVGIGLPGIVERGTRVRVVPAIPVLNDLSVGEEIAKRTGRPTFLENDANAAALAEAWIGAARDIANVLLVTIGTGIGGGVVLDGRIWSGRSGYAGEMGHIQVDENGVDCPCGSRGCVETFAGARGLRREAETRLATRPSSLKGRELDQKAIVEAAREGDAVALEVVDAAARALGRGIAATLLLLNLDRVVIGGGVAAAGPFLIDRIAEETRRRTFPQVFADCSFRPAELGGDAGVVGAARVAMQSVGA